MEQELKRLRTPLTEADIEDLRVGDMALLSGTVFCGRDAVLPRIVHMAETGALAEADFSLEGGVVFHTAVSPAGVGPTSSNKLEIEASMEPLSRLAKVRMHLGKGALKPETVKALAENGAVFAVIPPVTALLESRTLSRRVAAFPELGMEALHQIEVTDYPVIIAAARGESVYD